MQIWLNGMLQHSCLLLDIAGYNINLSVFICIASLHMLLLCEHVKWQVAVHRHATNSVLADGQSG